MSFGSIVVKGDIAGILLSEALTCMNIFLYKQKWLFFSRRRIPLAIFLYEQFIHLTHITVRLNTQLLSNRQHDNNLAKGICLLNKTAIFIYTGKVHTSKSF